MELYTMYCLLSSGNLIHFNFQKHLPEYCFLKKIITELFYCGKGEITMSSLISVSSGQALLTGKTATGYPQHNPPPFKLKNSMLLGYA